MRKAHLYSFITIFVVSLCFVEIARASGNLRSVARSAVEGSAEERARAVTQLRAEGEMGLRALFDEFAVEIKARRASSSNASVTGAEWERIAEALDAVGQQKGNFASQLFWHTDIEEARRAARETNRPILSLRLLGKLSDEYSCANSRFFRTALYSNAEVSKYLREHFVLHWKTVRPAPVVTVDYGDGRKLVRTITGNSIHYVLDAEGRVVDALPGLYGPQAFLGALGRVEGLARTSASLKDEERGRFLTRYYNTRALELISNLQEDAKRAGVPMPEGAIERGKMRVAQTNAPPTALIAAPLAITKAMVEVRTVRAITYTPILFQQVTDDAGWAKIAELHQAEARMDEASVSMLARHNPYVAPGASSPAAQAGASLARVVRNFELRMALDTVRNEYLMRPVLLRWLSDGAWREDVEKLNARVYAELFLTPDADPWLGLVAPDTYTALQNDGVVLSERP